MALSKDLKRIKNVYGEEFMHLCRELFPSLLEHEGRLPEILESSFSNNCTDLYNAISLRRLESELKNYIYSKVDVETPDKRIVERRTPYEILDEAGYNLFECKNEEEIQAFKKYYAHGEELCTFNGGRLERCEVFFAVKKDVEQIKREDFNTPKREDEYGTSVMGIQFSKQGICTVSIKNRYNHTVNNPDATYGNDLDKIAPGLAESFETLLKERGLSLNSENKEKFRIPGYVVANDGKYYKYNFESSGIYYCPKNIVITGGTPASVGEPEKKILMDNFIVDLENKTIKQFDDYCYHDSFVDAFEKIEKIEITKNKETKTRKIAINTVGADKSAIIEINENNEIIKYENENITKIKNNFMLSNKLLQKFNAPNLESVGNRFMHSNNLLKEFNVPSLEHVGDGFMQHNNSLKEFNVPSLEHVGDGFMQHSNSLKEFNAPNLARAGNAFMSYSPLLKKFNAPNLVSVGNDCMTYNELIEEFNAPNLVSVGDNFMTDFNSLKKFNAPNLESVGDGFMFINSLLEEFNAPNLLNVGSNFLISNKSLKEFNAPNLIDKRADEIRNQIYTKEITESDKKIQLTQKEIAELDRKTQLTQKEISIVKNILEKFKRWTRRKDNETINNESR